MISLVKSSAINPRTFMSMDTYISRPLKRYDYSFTIRNGLLTKNVYRVNRLSIRRRASTSLLLRTDNLSTMTTTMSIP